MSKISIIVPVYNVEKYLDRCIESILHQTFTDFELILIDDGSSDNCPSMCNGWAQRDSRIIVLHKKNGGVSSARNLGLDVAQGEYISFVDSDDVLHPQFYEIMINCIGDSEIAFCDYEKFSDHCYFDSFDASLVRKVFLKNEQIFNFPQLSFFIVWNKLIKSSVINGQRFDIHIKNAEDSLFVFDLLLKCSNAVFINEKLYGYFIREDSATRSIGYRDKIDIVIVWNYIYETMTQRGLNAVKKYTKHILLEHIVGLFYASKTLDEDIFNQTRKYLCKHLFTILFNKNSKLTIKEKAALVWNICFVN